ncbi:hypothetical protein [Kordiimonas lacus]|uniref:ABC-type nitrate/sulfonate/bicarbonate transport system, substrate-binding protein n=1 Tax=Kordiimonas lacus TaxID=637679 RepID=A0A1G6XZT3_9PROT|nr:hypothetical protein [Kordiimonas lacus]SDD83734.1 ABC-type nitrate/sulfonate/bicarbonate transport system, substrate-binding protein [Kordiimonas lacus]
MKQMLCCLIALYVLGGAAFAQRDVKSSDGASENCLKLGADETLGPHYPAYEQLITDLYKRAGLCAISIAMTPKRIEQLMANGKLDGDWFRPSEYIATRGLEQQIVPQAVFGLEARMIWLKDTGFSGDPADLNGLTVGYRAGFRWLETHIPLMGGKPFAISGGSQVKALLEHGRIHVYATSSAHEPNIIDAFGDSADRLTSKRWATEPFYHLLQPRHADKIPALTKALKDMIQDGDMQRHLTMPGVIAVPLRPEN